MTSESKAKIISPQTEASWWTQVSAESGELSPSILELCAGVGGMGVGASFLGGVPILAVDSNGLSCSHLTNHAHGEVLQLDITATGIVTSLLLVVPK